MFDNTIKQQGFIISGNPLRSSLVKIEKLFRIQNSEGKCSSIIYQLNNDCEVGYEASWLINYFSLYL